MLIRIQRRISVSFPLKILWLYLPKFTSKEKPGDFSVYTYSRITQKDESQGVPFESYQFMIINKVFCVHHLCLLFLSNRLQKQITEGEIFSLGPLELECQIEYHYFFKTQSSKIKSKCFSNIKFYHFLIQYVVIYA